jgi:hypothetical protein
MSVPLDDCYRSIIDTSLKCSRCQGPIFHAKGRIDPGLNAQIYACSCMVLEGKTFGRYNSLTEKQWDKYLRHSPERRVTGDGMELPPIGFLPSKRARRVIDVYKPEEHGKALTSQRARWGAACADAKDAIEELQSIQEHLQDWLENLPENFQDTPLAEKLSAICDIEFDAALETMEEAESAEFPLGFGRD